MFLGINLELTLSKNSYIFLDIFQGQQRWEDPRSAGAAEERGRGIGVVSVGVVDVAAAGQDAERQREEEVLTLQGGTG